MDTIDEAPDREQILQFREEPDDPETVARNRRILLDAIDGYRAGDLDAWWRIFDPDVTFHEAACLPYGGAHRGLEATKAGYAKLSDTFSKLHSVLETVLAGGDKVILYQDVSFRVRANGNSGRLPVSEMFRFRDGKVIEWRACYFDADLVAKAINGEAGD